MGSSVEEVLGSGGRERHGGEGVGKKSRDRDTEETEAERDGDFQRRETG